MVQRYITANSEI